MCQFHHFRFVICFFMVVFTIGVVSCTNDVNEDSIADENDSSIVFIESSISVNQMDSLLILRERDSQGYRQDIRPLRGFRS